MITKERLEELIEQGATIYFINSDFVDCKDSKYHGVEVGNNYASILYGGHWHDINYKNLFETEEDARWELEMTATRTETLKLPKFEQITSNKDDIKTRVVGFYVDRIYYILEYSSDLDGNWRICLEKDTIEDCEYLFEAEPTKENYLKACKMAKRLFLGEGEEI